MKIKKISPPLLEMILAVAPEASGACVGAVEGVDALDDCDVELDVEAVVVWTVVVCAM